MNHKSKTLGFMGVILAFGVNVMQGKPMCSSCRSCGREGVEFMGSYGEVIDSRFRGNDKKRMRE